LTTHDLQQWHAALFASEDPVRSETCGRLRLVEVQVYGRYAPPSSTVPGRLVDILSPLEDEISQVVEHDNLATRTVHGLHVCAWTYIRLVQVQPFRDGNKRIARFVILWAATRLGIALDFNPFDPPTEEFHQSVRGDTGRPLISYLAGLLVST